MSISPQSPKPWRVHLGAARPHTGHGRCHDICAGDVKSWRVRQPREGVSQPHGVSGAAPRARGEEFVLASPRRKPASARRMYSPGFEPARRALALFWQMADASPGHGGALGWASPLTLPAPGQAGGHSGAAWPGRGDDLGKVSTVSKTTVMLQPRLPASAGRNHLYFNPLASLPFPRSPWLPLSAFAVLFVSMGRLAPPQPHAISSSSD